MRSIVIAVAFAAVVTAAATAQTAQPASTAQPPVSPDLLDHYRRSTVSVGQVVNDGSGPKFRTVGSAVIVARDAKHAALMTAKHVVFEPDQGYIPTTMYIRLPQESASSAVDMGVMVPLVVNGKNLWQSLPDGSDLAIVPLPDLSKYTNLHAVFVQEFATSEDVFQGADIVVLGYPAILGEDYLTTPLARGGIVSWIDPTGPLTKRFLIDCNVFNGNSGGPVFHKKSGFTRSGGINIGPGLAFMGIVVADAKETVPVKAKANPITMTDPKSGEVSPVYAEILNIGGIGIVEPASKVLQLMDQAFDSKN
jgi:hypothetical protein